MKALTIKTTTTTRGLIIDKAATKAAGVTLKAGNSWDDRIVQAEGTTTIHLLGSKSHGLRITVTQIDGQKAEVKLMTGNGRPGNPWKIFAARKVMDATRAVADLVELANDQQLAKA